MRELNLLPYSYKEQQLRRSFYRNILASVILAICVIILSLYFPMRQLSSLERQSKNYQQRVASFQPILAEGDRLRKQLDELNSYINKVTSLTSTKIIVVDKIRGLQAFIPQDVYFNNLNYSDGTINISGITTNYSSISEFAANLQMSENYRNTKITNINFDEQANSYTFSIIIK